MPLKQREVGWDATSSREMKIKWEEILFFAVRWREWQYLPLPHCFKAMFELVRKETTAA